MLQAKSGIIRISGCFTTLDNRLLQVFLCDFVSTDKSNFEWLVVSLWLISFVLWLPASSKELVFCCQRPQCDPEEHQLIWQNLNWHEHACPVVIVMVIEAGGCRALSLIVQSLHTCPPATSYESLHLWARIRISTAASIQSDPYWHRVCNPTQLLLLVC